MEEWKLRADREGERSTTVMTSPIQAWTAVQAREPAAAWGELFGTARIHDAPAGSVIFGEQRRFSPAAVLGGVVRLYTVTATGRQLTGRYARPGDLVGLASAIIALDGWRAEAVTDVTLATLSSETLRSLAMQQPEFAWAVTREVTATWASMWAVASGDHGTMLSRIASHLLEVAMQTPDGYVVARVSHQRLAEAAGTAREVVTRILGSLREAGLIETRRGTIIVIDTEAVARIAAGEDAARAAP